MPSTKLHRGVLCREENGEELLGGVKLCGLSALSLMGQKVEENVGFATYGS